MSEEVSDPLHERLESWIGKSMSPTGPAKAPDEVNVPMIRHWVDAFDDRNPIYLDPEATAKTRFGEIVAPPAMMMTWTFPRPRIEGIAERGGTPDEIPEDHPITILDRAGYVGTLATNSELTFERYLHPGDHLVSDIRFESISNRKQTSLGKGYFVTWATIYTDQHGEVVGRQLFRIFKFDPSTIDPARFGASS
jgi:acyl dehydratase